MFLLAAVAVATALRFPVLLQLAVLMAEGLVMGDTMDSVIIAVEEVVQPIFGLEEWRLPIGNLLLEEEEARLVRAAPDQLLQEAREADLLAQMVRAQVVFQPAIMEREELHPQEELAANG